MKLTDLYNSITLGLRFLLAIVLGRISILSPSANKDYTSIACHVLDHNLFATSTWSGPILNARIDSYKITYASIMYTEFLS